MLNISDLISLLNAVVLPNTGNNTEWETAKIQYLLYDTRRITYTEGAVFIALQSRQNDGHYYLAKAYQQGVRLFIVQKGARLPENWSNFAQNAVTLIVENTLTALQQIAKAHRLNFPALRTIGITGSNGKTIVKEWLYQILRIDETIVRSPKSYNSQIGVPLSVWQISADDTLGIFEAGISEAGEMKALADLIQPTIGVFTNLGAAHNAGFKNNIEKALEKLDLFSTSEILIYSRDYLQLDKAVQLKYPDKKRFTWTTKTDIDADIRLIDTTPSTRFPNGQRLHIALPNDQAEGQKDAIGLDFPFSDRASIENMLCCVSVMVYLGYNYTEIMARIPFLEPVELRLELKAAINNCTLINDSYNSDLNSLDIALTFAKQHQRNTTLTVVLSDILESGKSVASLYKSVAVLLRQYTVQQIIGIGSTIAALRDFLPEGSQFLHFATTDEFLNALTLARKPKPNEQLPLLTPIFQNTTILLKGARTYEFERIATVLGQKQHRTTLEVNLSALSHNLRVYKSFLQPETLLMVMVKAAAYGSGSDQVARCLSLEKVDYLAVAYTDEGYELRQEGILLPIMVMNVEPSSFEPIIRYRLEPELYSRSIFEGFLAAVRQQNLAEPYPIHLKLDTGMHRLGFEPQDIDWLCALLQDQKDLYIASVFTHLAATDNPAHDDFTEQQAARFTAMYEQIVAVLPYRPLRHILNSGGINRFANAYQMDMVRLGIGLYGIDGSDEIQYRLQTVMTLNATISQIKHVPAGESVGYNRMSRTTTPTRIATVSIGYADGLNRLLSNGKGGLYVRGQYAPIIGNVCMDMCMIDITNIPNAAEGDSVEVFGTHQTVQHLSAQLNTIPYELFTSVSSRVKRIYFQE